MLLLEAIKVSTFRDSVTIPRQRHVRVNPVTPGT